MDSNNNFSEEINVVDFSEVVSQLDKKYPLFNQLSFHTSYKGKDSKLPEITAVLAAMLDPDIPGDTCILLPSKYYLAPYLAVIVAFSAAKNYFPTARKEYLEKGFQAGDLVRVRPQGYVYIYDGFFDIDGYDNQFFRLNVIDSKTGEARTIPISEAVRLEKTTTKTPKGKGSADLSNNLKRSDLDRVIGINTYGNDALISNEVILVTTQKVFKDFLETTYVIKKKQPNIKYKLDEIIPWGVINQEGELEYKNRSSTSKPLIAISPRLEYVANACSRIGKTNPRVIVDGVNRVNDLDALDTVIDLSKLLILAEDSDVEKMSLIESRNCKIGRFSYELSELFHEDDNALSNLENDYNISKKTKFTLHPRPNRDIDKIINKIVECKKIIESEELEEDSAKLIAHAYYRVFSISGVFCSLEEQKIDEFRNQIKLDLQLLREKKPWLIIDLYKMLMEVFEEVAILIELISDSNENNKSKDLINLLNDNENAVIVAHNKEAYLTIKKLLKDTNYKFDLISIDEVKKGQKTKKVIITGWPNSNKLHSLIYKYVSGDIHFLCYGFEYKWFGSFKNHFANSKSRYLLNAQQLYELTNVNFPELDIKQSKEKLSETKINKIMDFEYFVSKIKKGNIKPCENLEESRDAKYISFNGDAYTYCTASHKFAVVTELFTGGSINHDLLKNVDELNLGDIVLVRDYAGSGDLIRDIAEQSANREIYLLNRKISEEWKHQLFKLGSNANIAYGKLKNYGYNKSIQTLYGWFVDEHRIGPGNIEDLEIIANSSGDENFKKNLNNIWASIKYIRSAHQSLGSRLTAMLIKYLPKNVSEFTGEQTNFELNMEEISLGKVFLLQIDKISREYEKISQHDVNHIRWQ